MVSKVPMWIHRREKNVVSINTAGMYRATSLIKTRLPLGPYSRRMPMVLRRSYGWGIFFVQGYLA